MVKIDIQQITDTHCKFVVEGVHPYFVNALRRTLLAEVPKLAIDTVTFYDNTSALFDEMVSHRLGMVPIPTDPSTLNLKGQVDEEGNPTYLVRYTLTKEGPCTVYSGDLEAEDPQFEILEKQVPIVDLLQGQRLILECTAILGDGTEHAKWQVASGVGYKYYPTAKVDNRKIKADDAQMVVERTPTGILGLDGNKLVILDEAEVNRASEAVKILGAEAFQIDYDDRKFVFQFETDGALKAEDALLKAVELLKDRFKGFGDAVDSLD